MNNPASVDGRIVSLIVKLMMRERKGEMETSPKVFHSIVFICGYFFSKIFLFILSENKWPVNYWQIMFPSKIQLIYRDTL
jgi:hypothetical protein